MNRFAFSALSALTVIALFVATAYAGDRQSGRFGDQGDGTFRNPILAADYSDPDVCRVGDDFYEVASTFESSPGVTVLHSKDLVNWNTIGSAIPDVSQLGPNFNWDHMRQYNEGVYAPSIRFHEGKFWVFVNIHGGEGFFQSTAKEPSGPWTVVQLKDMHSKAMRCRGWTDPCPFWDDDGNAYLASSHPSSRWYSYLFKMTPDGTQLLDADIDKLNHSDGPYDYPGGGTLISPFHSSEGNKIFKRDGLYYLQHIEFLDSGQGHGTYVFRSKNIYGSLQDGSPGQPGNPGKYEVMKFGDSIPGQGGFVDTVDGRWFWIGQLNCYGSDGRRPSLLPVTWIDQWPVPGVNINGLKGEMAWQLKKPIDGDPIQFPLGSDDFDSTTLFPGWEWNHQPRADHWSLTERPGWLRLHAWQPLKKGSFFTAGNSISQRFFRSDLTTAIVKLDIAGMADSQRGGLVHFNGGKTYAAVEIMQTKGARSLVYEENGKLQTGPDVPNHVHDIWLQSITNFDDLNHYSYSFDGKAFVDFGGNHQLTTGNYRGDQVGVFTFNDDADAGYLDVDFFHYTFANTGGGDAR